MRSPDKSDRESDGGRACEVDLKELLRNCEQDQNRDKEGIPGHQKARLGSFLQECLAT